MKQLVRILVPVAVFAGLFALGLFAARAWFGADDAVTAGRARPTLVDLGQGSASGATSPAPGSEVRSADLARRVDRVIPVIAPTAIGAGPTDDTPVDELLAEPVDPPVPSDDGTVSALPTSSADGSAVIGAVGMTEPLPAPSELPMASLPTVDDATGEPAATVPDTVPDTATDTATATATDTVPDTATVSEVGGEAVADDGFDWARFLAFSDRYQWLELLGPIAFDPCAGPEPAGDDVPAGCAGGYAATFALRGGTPPAPQIYASPGYTEAGDGIRGCRSTPATPAGTTEMSLATFTPLAEASFRYRPYGSGESWVTIELGPTAADDVDWWFDYTSSDGYDVFGGILTSCFAVPVDDGVGYEFFVWGTDVFGQWVEQGGGLRHLPPAEADARPVTTARVDAAAPVATVTGWAREGGEVRFRSRPVLRADDALSCDGATPVRSDRLFTDGIGLPTPVGFWDPDFRFGFGAVVPLLPGESVLVCADVNASTNPFSTIVTDRLLVNAPSTEVPVVRLVGTRRGSSARAIPTGLSVSTIATDGSSSGCERSYLLPALQAGMSRTFDVAVWQCLGTPVPVDSTGAAVVPLRVVRELEPLVAASRRVTEVAIPIRVGLCRVPSGCRPTEVYEVPIPMESRSLCGSSFGAGCEPPSDGTLVFRVSYPVVSPPVGEPGSARLLDAIVPARPDTPRLTVPTYTQLDGDDPFHRDLRIEVQADRPVRVTFVPREHDLDPPLLPCATLTPVSSGGFSDRPTAIVRGLCGGMAYSFDMQVVDEEGRRSDIDTVAWEYIQPAQANMFATLTVLGGRDLPELGEFARVKVSAGGSTQTFGWWEMRSTRTGSTDRCRPLNGTQFTPNGGRAPTTWFVPETLTVEVEVVIGGTGSADCEAAVRDFGTFSFTAELTREQLLAGDRYGLSTPRDAPLRMTLELTGRGWDWIPPR